MPHLRNEAHDCELDPKCSNIRTVAHTHTGQKLAFQRMQCRLNPSIWLKTSGLRGYFWNVSVPIRISGATQWTTEWIDIHGLARSHEYLSFVFADAMVRPHSDSPIRHPARWISPFEWQVSYRSAFLRNTEPLFRHIVPGEKGWVRISQGIYILYPACIYLNSRYGTVLYYSYTNSTVRLIQPATRQGRGARTPTG